MDHLPSLSGLSDFELKELIHQIEAEEQDLSYRRRLLHGQIDIARAELVDRLTKKRQGGEAIISLADVERLSKILSEKTFGNLSDQLDEPKETP